MHDEPWDVKGENSQGKVLNVMMFQTVRCDKDTIPTAFSRNISTLHGSFLDVLSQNSRPISLRGL